MDDYCTGLPDWEHLVPSHRVVRPEGHQGPGHLPQHVLQELRGAGQEWHSYSNIFQAVKLRWLLVDSHQDNVAAAHYECRLLAGEAPALHVLHTDPLLQASRTGLMNIHTQTWDTQLATFYGEPLNIMPRILASGDIFDMLEMTSLVGVNITGCMGDQQAAIVGHCCTSPGMSKVTLLPPDQCGGEAHHEQLWADAYCGF